MQGGVDGYSHLITFLRCSTDNTASTMLIFFVAGGAQYGFPSRVRSDYGGENYDVAKLMLHVRGENHGSHLTGKSIHNNACGDIRLFELVLPSLLLPRK